MSSSVLKNIGTYGNFVWLTLGGSVIAIWSLTNLLTWRSSGGRVGVVLTTLNMSSEVPGFDPCHLQTTFKLLEVSECYLGIS